MGIGSPPGARGKDQAGGLAEDCGGAQEKKTGEPDPMEKQAESKSSGTIPKGFWNNFKDIRCSSNSRGLQEITERPWAVKTEAGQSTQKVDVQAIRCKRLALRIIDLAKDDATNGASRYMTEQSIKEAREWLTSDHYVHELKFWCEMAGLSWQAVRESTIKMLSGKMPRRKKVKKVDAVIGALKNSVKPLTAVQMAQELGATEHNIRNLTLACSRILQRLHKKGWVDREKKGRPVYVYTLTSAWWEQQHDH